MKKTLIWDIPTRLFHWGFAGSITASFVFALVVGKHSPLFQLHMVFGIVAAFLLVIRLVIGLVGSRHARFASFPLNPAKVVSYFVGVFTGNARVFPGHNPGSALAAVAMFLLVPAIVLTGIGGNGEAFEDVHTVLAYTLLGVIGAHLLGIILHTVRHRENIATSMVTGRKDVIPAEAIGSGRPAWGAAVVVAAGAWIFALFANHDAKAGTVKLPLLGTVVQLGENEGGEHEGGRSGHGEGRNSGEGRHDDDDDDD